MHMFDERIGLILVASMALLGCDPGSKSVTASDDPDEESSGETGDSASSTTGGTLPGDSTAGDKGDQDTGSPPNPTGTDTTTSTTGDPPPPAEEPCLEEPTVLGSDEISPLGFPASDLIALSNGWGSDFVWTTDTGPIDVVPAGTTTQLNLGLTYVGGEILYIESEPNPDWEGGEIGLDCEDRIEMEMELIVQTLDGRFDETFTAVTTATTADALTFMHWFDPYGFGGTFSADEVSFPEDNGTVDRFALRGLFTASDSPTGGLWIEVTQWLPDNPETAFTGFGIIAGWPSP